MEGLGIRIIFKTNLTTTPLYIEIIVFRCKPKDCNIEVEIVSIEVKKIPIDKMDNSGAALATDTGSLKSNANMGPDKTAIPIEHGMDMMEANFKQLYIIFIELALPAILSSSVDAFLIAVSEAVKVGVKEEAIG